MIIDRSTEQSYPGSEWRPGTLASPASQRESLLSSPNACMVQWWQAYSNPAYLKNTGGVGQNAYLRDLQAGEYGAFRVIIQSTEQALKRWFPVGSYSAGDIAVLYDETTLPLSIYDWIIPYGAGTSDTGLLDAATFTYKETLVRASTQVALQGTITSTGTAVVGSGTAFTAALHVGDVLGVLGAKYVVAAIAQDTSLTLATAPPINWTGVGFSVWRDRVTKSPIAQIVQVRDGSGIYSPSQYGASQDLGGIDWLTTAQPAPAAQYAVSYRYFPTYQVTEYGRKGRIVHGAPELSVSLCQLLNPDTQQR